MIASVQTTTSAGKQISLRLGTAAMVRLERQFEKPINVMLSEAGSGMSVEMIAGFFRESFADGKGCPEDAAFDLIDELGGPQEAVELVAKTIEAAFPQADPEAAPEGSKTAAPGKAKKAAE